MVLAKGSVYLSNDILKREEIKKDVNRLNSELDEQVSKVESIEQTTQEAMDKVNEFNGTITGVKEQVNQAVSDASNAITKAEQATTDSKEAHDKAVSNTQTIQSFKEETNGTIAEIKADSEALATVVSNKAEQSEVTQLAGQISEKVSNDEYQSFKVQTAGQIASVVSNSDNLWGDGGFELLKLSEYTDKKDNNPEIKITSNGAKNTPSEKENSYGEEFKINNNTEKILMIKGKTTGNVNVYCNRVFSINPGDIFRISFDFRKTGTGDVVVGFKYLNDKGETITWRSIAGKKNDGSNWWHKNGKIIVPDDFDGKIPARVQPYVAFNKTGSDNDFVLIDNVDIIKQDASQTFQSQTVDSLVERVTTNEGKITEVTKTADGILTTISDPTTGLEATYNKAQSAQGEVTQIKNLQGSSTIVNTVKGVQTTVESKADKSQITQLAGQITEVVESQDSINKQIQTATSKISSIENMTGSNKLIQTVNGTKQEITDTRNQLSNQITTTANAFDVKLNNLEEETNSRISATDKKVTLIASDDKNNSYFYVGSDGMVTVGASYKFLIKADTEVAEGFTLSANNISAGKITGSKPNWMTNPSGMPLPSDFKNDYYSPTIDLDTSNNKLRDYGLSFNLRFYRTMAPNLQEDGKIATVETALYDNGLGFSSLYWDNTANPTLNIGQKAGISGNYDPKSPENTCISMYSGARYGITAVSSDVAQYYWDQTNKKPRVNNVVVGKDGADANQTALASASIYVNRLQSMHDGGNIGITMSDRLICTETMEGTHVVLSGDLTVNGKVNGVLKVDAITSSDDGANKMTTFKDKVKCEETIYGGYADFSATVKAGKFTTSALLSEVEGIATFEVLADEEQRVEIDLTQKVIEYEQRISMLEEEIKKLKG